MPERCDMNTTSAHQRRLHLYRYRTAAGYIRPDDVVIDAACSTGYGRQILPRCYRYIGLDYWIPEEYLEGETTFKSEESDPVRLMQDTFIQCDLSKPLLFPINFEVFISIETIEHLENFTHLVRLGKQARRLMFITTPITPTKHANPYHVHDFTKESVCGIFEDKDWKLTHFEEQPAKSCTHGIFVFERR